MSGTWMAAEIAQQPQVLSRLVDAWEQDVARVQDLLPERLRAVAFVARGSSDNAAVLGRYAVEVFAGLPAMLAAPSVVTRYQAPLRYDDTLVVGLSQSGATPEVATVCTALRGERSRTLAITNDSTSPLATACDALLGLRAGAERAVPATKTVTASMLAVLAVATAVARHRGRPDPLDRAAIAALPGVVARTVADDQACAALAARWSGRDRLQVVGRGVGLGAVLETALKVRETTGVFAQGLSSADLAHGPVAALDGEVPVLLVDTGGPGSGELADLADAWSGDVDVARWAVDARTDRSLPQGWPEPLCALVAVIRGQQLALAWAHALGRDPDAPAGLTKVTATC